MIKPTTQRFLDLFEKLKEEGKINSDAEFSKRLDYKPQSFSQIKKGARDAPLELLTRFINEYDMDANLIFKENKSTKYK